MTSEKSISIHPSRIKILIGSWNEFISFSCHFYLTFLRKFSTFTILIKIDFFQQPRSATVLGDASKCLRRWMDKSLWLKNYSAFMIQETFIASYTNSRPRILEKYFNRDFHQNVDYWSKFTWIFKIFHWNI